jgi:hypothetical protein
MLQHGCNTWTPKQLNNKRLLEMAPKNQMFPLPSRAISSTSLTPCFIGRFVKLKHPFSPSKSFGNLKTKKKAY